MNEDQDLSTRARGRSPMHDKLQVMVCYKHDKIKRSTHVQDDMRKLPHQEELPSLSFVARVRFV